jgi:amino acid adenylation domain-containing protein
MLEVLAFLDDILRHQARRSPAKTAVICGEARLTYGELDRASSNLDRRLRELGVKPGDRVGLLCARNLAAVVALFAVLKRRAAYVPLDPTGPIGRSLQICKSCGIEHLVAGAPQARKLAAAPEVDELRRHIRHVVVVERRPDREARTSESGEEVGIAPPGDADPDETLAYILFTSGSTGEPKGVMVSHRAALSFAEWAADYVGLGHQDRCANHAPLLFDLSTFEIFATMLAGGTVVIVPPALSAFPDELVRYIGEQEITVWYSVPSVWLDLLGRPGLGDLDDLGCLRTIIYAGEPFPPDRLRVLMHRLPRCTIYNFFGPTETNVCAAHRLPRPPDPDAVEVPIGQLCSGFSGLLLDESGRPVARGEIGELYVTGPSTMLGYWGMPAETTKVFCLPPGLEHDLEAGRYYRTGDFVRQGSDDLLYFVGRRDTQVKIHGFRVELGEVEAALCSLPGVDEACALTTLAATVENELVAFVTSGGGEVDIVAVLAGLRQRLPGYKIPRRIYGMERLPRTPTGKIDRRRLAEELVKMSAEG